MFGEIAQLLYPLYEYLRLPAAAKAERREDRLGIPREDPGIDRAIEEGVAWLCRAQDNSASHDWGVARHYSLITGWATSYPETTGYIVPTMLMCANVRGDGSLIQRARRMLDWLVSIQMPEGAYQGGTIETKPAVPVTFNTGQILIGLAIGVRELGDAYREAMCRAADWLVATQDPDGCWRSHSTPYAASGEKAYETHVAWGLLEAARLEPDKPYADAALANVRWALSMQQDNGWVAECCLTDPSQPLTHTLGYLLRGIIEAYRFTEDATLLAACRKTADGLLAAIDKDGFLPGRLGSDWHGTVPWVCLTGSVQIAHCWLMLYQYLDNPRYRDAAYAANRYVRQTMKIQGPPETRGAIKGSFPVDGAYGRYTYLNWAAKFFIDSNLREKATRGQ